MTVAITTDLNEVTVIVDAGVSILFPKKQNKSKIKVLLCTCIFVFDCWFSSICSRH